MRAPPEEGRALAPVRVARRSAETRVEVTLRDAAGESARVRVELEEPLFRHLIESFATWARLDLRLRAVGDLDHHLVEDVALVLGRALRTSLGALPRQRVADATVPMDDALVLVALDLADRPHCEIVGEFPGLFDHFLRSMATEARWTLHVRAIAGRDPHHVAEAAVKALAVAFRAASRPARAIRSRKGAPEWSVEPGD